MTEALYLEEIEAVRPTAGVVLDRLVQVLCVLYLAAAEHVSHVDSHFLITPIQLIDVCVVTCFDTFVRIFRPVNKIKSI